MDRKTVDIDLGHGAVKKQVTISTNDCDKDTAEARAMLHHLLETLATAPEIMIATLSYHPDRITIRHDGQRWIARIEEDML